MKKFHYLDTIISPNITEKSTSLSEFNKVVFKVHKNASKDFTNHDWNGNNVLLFGSEGYGIKYQTSKNSDFLLKININQKVESLNISNSAAVVFHHINNLKKNK